MKKHIVFLATMFSVVAIGCAHSQYNTSKLGPDTYRFSGPDQNQLKANAYKTCTDDGFYDYSFVDSDRNSLTVKCEPKPKDTFTKISDMIDNAREKIKELQNK